MVDPCRYRSGVEAEEEEVGHRSTQPLVHFEAVIDHMGDSQFGAVPSLIGTFTTEAHIFPLDAGLPVEVVMIEPLQGAFLHSRAAFGDHPRPSFEPGHQPRQHLESPIAGRSSHRFFVAAREKNGIRSPVVKRCPLNHSAEIYSESWILCNHSYFSVSRWVRHGKSSPKTLTSGCDSSKTCHRYHDRKRLNAGRNHSRVLEAAIQLFGERGTEVQMSEVASAAGFGIGTVYRHFPTGRTLVEAVAEQRFLEILDYARRTCPTASTGREAVRYLLVHIGHIHEQERTLSGLLESTLGDTAPHGEVQAGLHELGTDLVARGKADGTFRPDITFGDLYMIVGALATVARAKLGDWQRFIDIALAGLEPRKHPEKSG